MIYSNTLQNVQNEITFAERVTVSAQYPCCIPAYHTINLQRYVWNSIEAFLVSTTLLGIVFLQITDAISCILTRE